MSYLVLFIFNNKGVKKYYIMSYLEVMNMQSIEKEKQLSNKLRSTLKESLSIFNMGLQGQKKIFVTGKWNTSSASLNQDSQQRGKISK